MRIVFDLDDTISVHRNRDYANATPVNGVVSRMRQLRAEMPDAQIVILTARGMASCNGDAKLAEERNRPVLEKWLADNDVPYDEIIFGKPLGDAYVDDKAVSVEEFSRFGCKTLKGGFSGKSVVRVGTIVVKTCDNAQEIADWYSLAHAYGFKSVSFPHLISHQLGKMYLRYEDGTTMDSMTCEDILRLGMLSQVRNAIREFGSREYVEQNDVGAYIRYVAERCKAIGIDPLPYCKPIESVSSRLKTRTFHHGDFSTMNLVVREGNLVAIDPNPKGDVQCHLVDAAKFYASLCGLEAVLADRQVSEERVELGRRFLATFDYIDTLAVVALAKTLVVRVSYYAHLRGDTAKVKRLLEGVAL